MLKHILLTATLWACCSVLYAQSTLTKHTIKSEGHMLLIDVEIDIHLNKYYLFSTRGDTTWYDDSFVFAHSGSCSNAICYRDILLLALSPTNDVLYKKQIWGMLGSSTFSIAQIDTSILLIGAFYSDTLFSSDTILVKDAPDNGNNLFAFKFNLEGELIESVQFPVEEKQTITRIIAMPARDKILLSGRYGYSTLCIDGFKLPPFNGRVHDSNIFLAMLNSDLQVEWMHRISGDHEDILTDIAVDNQGNILLSGFFYSFQLFIDSTATDLFSHHFFAENFLLKFNSAGEPLWQRQMKDPNEDDADGLSIGPNNNIYLSGSYEGYQLDFGDTIIDNPAAAWNAFIASYDPDGNVNWVNQVEGDLASFTAYNALDSDQNIWLTGFFDSDSTFSVGDFDFSVEEDGGGDIYIAKFSPDGQVLYANVWGGPGLDRGLDIRPYGDNILITAISRSPFIPIGDDTLYNPFESDMIFFFEMVDPTSSIVPVDRNTCNLTLYPNPVERNQTLYIEPGLCNFSQGQVSIIASTGAVVHSEYYEQGEIKMPDLPAGIYFLNVTIPSARAIEKIIVLDR